MKNNKNYKSAEDALNSLNQELENKLEKEYLENLLKHEKNVMKYNRPVKFNKLAQNILDATTDFVQSNKYVVVNPGLTHFNLDEIISHDQLINFMTSDPFALEQISVLPLAENV